MDYAATEERCTEIMKRMYELTEDKSSSDLILLVGGRSFHVHKFVLAAASTVLKNTILSEVTTGENGVSTLTLDHVAPNGVHLLLDFIYDGLLPEFSNSHELQDFKAACDVLGVSVPELLDCDDDVFNGCTASVEDAKSPEIYVEITTGWGGCTQTENTSEPSHSALKSTCYVKIEPLSNELSLFNQSKECQFPEDSVRSSTESIVRFANPKSVESQQVSFQNETEEIVDIRIVDDGNMSDSISYSDWEYAPESEEHNDDDEIDKRKSNEKEKSEVKGRPIIVKGLDISGLFSTKKRKFLFPIKPNRLPPPVPDPSLSLKRGRPRLANDHLFPNVPPYICPDDLCGKEFDTREKLKKHYRCHGERTRSCGNCSKKFFYKKDLIAHLRTHTGERPFKCAVCDKGFAQKATLQYHMKMHNDARLEYFCEVCSNHYKTFKGLKTHIEKKHSNSEKRVFTPDLGMLHNPVSCPVCSNRFRNYQSLNQHMKRQHPNSSETKCLSKARTNRKIHATIKDRTPRRVMVVKEQPVSSATRQQKAEVSEDMDSPPQFPMDIQNISIKDGFTFSCATCGMNVQTREAYMKHYENCEGVSQYVCGYCDQYFASPKLRLQHVRNVHNAGEKTFESDATLTSIEGIVTTENLGNVRILNLENIF